jgi:hypothetical protein
MGPTLNLDIQEIAVAMSSVFSRSGHFVRPTGPEARSLPTDQGDAIP